MHMPSHDKSPSKTFWKFDTPRKIIIFKPSYCICIWNHGFILVIVGHYGFILIWKNCVYDKIIEYVTIGQHETKTLWDQVGKVINHSVIDFLKWHFINYDFIYSLASEVVFMESKKIDKEGIKTKTTELGYKGKTYDDLRKVSKLRANNLIQANHVIY